MEDAPGKDLIWCAADAHLTDGDRALPIFLNWIGEFEGAGVGTLVLLGDLFRVWIGLPGAEGPEQRKVLDRLASLTSAGRKVVYLAGNRDYFAEVAGRKAGIAVEDSWDFQVPGGAKVRFEHGHLVNRSDKRYLRWHALSRSSVARGAFRCLPARMQRALARRVEGRLSRTNASYKNYEPVLELEAWATRARQEGVGAAVLGHFHLDAMREIAGLHIRLMPQFREEGLHLRLGPTGGQRLVAFAGRTSRI